MKQGHNEIHNIGSGRETSDKQMFDILARLLGYQREPIFTEVRPGEIDRICLDATKAQAKLGWQTRVPLEEGLLTTIAYYKNRLLKASASSPRHQT
jgi:UDP-glucose 4-epimerase